MKTFRSGRGGRGGRGGRAARGNKGGRGGRGDRRDTNDFRWRKEKESRKRARATLERSGDALEDDDSFSAVTEQPNNNTQPNATSKEEKNRAMKERERNAKRQRREMHNLHRENADELIRKLPHEYLWEKYVEWAGTKLSSVEKVAEKWTKEQVYVVEEDGKESLIPSVKEIVGVDYVAQGEWRKGKKAGVAIIALGCSALRAVGLAKRLYDGKPVGKLFSKHIKIEEQRQWLAACCGKGLAPSAVGTAKRVQRLVEEGDLALEYTTTLIIDMSRDVRLRNIIDLNSMREELFDFIHCHGRPCIGLGKMKVILIIPKDQATKTEAISTKEE